MKSSAMEALMASQDRRAAQVAHAPVFRCDDGHNVFVFDPHMIHQIFQSDNFENVSIWSHYAALAQSTGHNMDTTIAVLGNIPAILNGADHRPARIAMAKLIQSNMPAFLGSTDAYLEQFFNEKIIEGATFEMFGDLAMPMVRSLARIITGLSEADIVDLSVTHQIANRGLSLRSRIEAEAVLKRLIARMDVGLEQGSLNLATASFFSFVFAGTLVGAIWQTLSRHGGQPLRDIPWPDQVPSVAIQGIERVAVRDCTIGGFKFHQHDVLRLMVDASAQYGPLAPMDLQFGRGRHNCLGRRLVEGVWGQLIRRFRNSDLSFELGEIAYKATNYGFPYQNRGVITVHDNKN